MADKLVDCTEVTMPSQDLIDLRHLVGVAAWIRSEQVAGGEAGLSLLEVSNRGALPDYTTINAANMCLENIRRDLALAQKIYMRLTRALEDAGLSSTPPSSWSDKT